MSDFMLYLGMVLVVIGIVVLLADVAHPGLFLLIPAAVAIAVGLMLIAVPWLFFANPVAAALIILAVGCGGGVAAIPIYQRIAPLQHPIATTVDTLTNMRASVVVAIQPKNMKGKVRVRGEVWSATSDVAIPAGEEVVITGGQGIVLNVSPVPSETKENEK
jgi:membrane protein implicated in regulation of membrane protease activity